MGGQVKLANEFVRLAKQKGIKEGYLPWKQAQAKKQEPSNRKEWNGTIKALGAKLRKEYEQEKHRSMRAACKSGYDRYTYDGKLINMKSLYQAIKGT